jgi:glutaminase
MSSEEAVHVSLMKVTALLAQGYAAEAIPHLQKVGAQEALGIAQIEAQHEMQEFQKLQSTIAAPRSEQ